MPYVFKQKSEEEKTKLKNTEKVVLIIVGLMLVLVPIYFIRKRK